MISEAWSEARVGVLRTMIAQGVPASHIARALNADGGVKVSRSAVIGKAHRLGLSVARKTVRPPRPKRDKRLAPRAITPVTTAGAPTEKRMKPDNHKPKGATPGPSNIPFITRTDSHCPMFIEGEEGPDGMICGRAVERGAFCASCYSLVYVPVRERAA